jgi:hypothetical protein
MLAYKYIKSNRWLNPTVICGHRKNATEKGNSKGVEKGLYEEIGRLKMELDWLKKKADML